MNWAFDTGIIVSVGTVIAGLAFWLGQLDRKVEDHAARLSKAAPQTDVDDLDDRVTKVEQSIREIHEVKQAQAAQGATIDSIAKNVDRLVRLHDDAKRERA